MDFFEQGGFMMYPLLALSLFACTIIIERFLFYSSFSMAENPDGKVDYSKLELSQLKEIINKNNFISQARFEDYKALLLSDLQDKGKESLLYNEADNILAKCGFGLNMLNTIVRVAPLMGLLGTVIGMIDTFSTLAYQESGVDIGLLADGIWQALITTATGLVIAIFALFPFQYYANKKKKVAEKLEALARISLAYSDEQVS